MWQQWASKGSTMASRYNIVTETKTALTTEHCG